MKRLLLPVLLAALPLAASAAPRGNSTDIDELAEATGLTPRLVQMVVGNPTAYAEYLTQYDFARHRMRQVLGTQRFDDLVAGRTIRLDDGRQVAIEVAQR
jgi:hypothetical protein